MIADWENSSKDVCDLFNAPPSKYNPDGLCLIVTRDLVVHHFNTQNYEEYVYQVLSIKYNTIFKMVKAIRIYDRYTLCDV
jgi:hypothetical protein